MSAEKLLAEIAARPRHRGALFLDIEDMLEIDAALAAGQSQDPSDLVTRESAVQAIEHVTIYNGGGRDRDARDMLVSATQPQAPQGAVTDAERYQKLRRWMSSNVKEGWTEVENLGAIAAYMGWEAMDQALDGLPVCEVGLCSPPAAPETPEGKK